MTHCFIMEHSLEDLLNKAVLKDDYQAVQNLLGKGANPNKNTTNGRTSLGEAANMGNIEIVKLLVDASKNILSKPTMFSNRKRNIKSNKRKLRNIGESDETVVKIKNLNERGSKEHFIEQRDVENVGSAKYDKNQGYFVFIHSEGSSSDESRVASLKSPLSPTSLTPSPQADLEWDEEIGNITVAPTTSEDETWSSMYRWYAAILECTGAAIASASKMTYGIDQQDAYMRCALHYAAEHGHTGVIKLLIDGGSKVDITAGDGLTPLHVAVAKNHADVVKMLLAAGSNVNYKTHEKMTSLHFAASRGFIDLVSILVNNGAYLEARDTNERTALYLAAGRGHIDVVKYLVAAGANVNGEEIHGYTPLCEAVWQRNSAVVDLLLNSGARVTHSHKLLHNAIIQRQDEIVKMLANLSGGINLHNDNGDTPLLLAARLSQPAVARILLQKGANVNACNNITGANTLHIAVESVDCPKEFEELLVSLLEYKIDMNAIALTGDTALNRALLLQKDHAAVLLVRYGADVNACDLHSCGLDNLSIASRRRNNNLAQILLKAGHYTMIPDLPLLPQQGSTAVWLYHACKRPLHLTDLCRIKIRSMSKNRILFRYINSLPLPKSLKSFLLIEDEGL